MAPQPSLWGRNYDTPMPKHESEAREIGEEQETEMKGSSVEDNRHIDLNVEWRSDYDGATPDAWNRRTKKIWTNLSITAQLLVVDRRGEASLKLTKKVPLQLQRRST